MAKAKATPIQRVKSKVNRKGVHAKSKTSNNKRSKNYVKPYNRQGR